MKANILIVYRAVHVLLFLRLHNSESQSLKNTCLQAINVTKKIKKSFFNKSVVKKIALYAV